MSWKARLDQLGITLPQVASPAGAYVPAIRHGDLVFTSGQLPLVQGTLQYQGKVSSLETGEGFISPDDGYQAAKICALNALAAIDALVGLDSITQIVKVVGFVASAKGFTQQPLVINGASEFLMHVFGEQGQHARSAVGVAELPRATPVEVELIAAISQK